MAVRKQGPDRERYYWPKQDAGFCVFCGCTNYWQADRCGRPYLACVNCRARVFPSGKAAIIGVEFLQKIIKRIGLSKFREMVQKEVILEARSHGPS